MEGKPLVLVTGVTGYVGSWVTLKLAEAKKYKIRATMRNPDNKEKVDLLEKAFGEHFSNIELVKADLTDRDSIFKAVEGCTYVMHVASPFPLESPRNEDDVLVPAIEGTMNVLEASKEYGIKRVILTSSAVTINDGSRDGQEIDETVWSEDNDVINTYYKSKIRAEKAAWDFVNKLSEEDKFELVSLNPGGIFGPLLFKDDGTSQKFITDIINGNLPSIPNVCIQFVDVRDVADAHVKAIDCKPFERYCISEGTYMFPELAEILHNEYSQYGYGITYKAMWTSTIWVASWILKDAAFFYAIWKSRVHVKNDKSIKELGMKYIDAKTCFKDMFVSLAEHGYIRNLL